MVTGIYARRFFAMPADSGKGSIFTQRCNTIILRMIKIIATHLAFLAFVTDL
jgi:hypothetical protein